MPYAKPVSQIFLHGQDPEVDQPSQEAQSLALAAAAPLRTRWLSDRGRAVASNKGLDSYMSCPHC
jgi:hypothetical protein